MEFGSVEIKRIFGQSERKSGRNSLASAWAEHFAKEFAQRGLRFSIAGRHDYRG